MSIFRSKNGRVDYYTCGLPGCCGITVVYDIDFYDHDKRNFQKLFKDWHKHLTKDHSGWNGEGYLCRGKLIISDATTGEDSVGPYPAKFCRDMGWDELGTKQYNSNSGRWVTMFEYNRGASSRKSN